jgi:hypothetical protein
MDAAAARGRPDVAWVGMDSVDTAASGKGLEASRRRVSADRAEFVKGDRRGKKMGSLSEIAVG